jgi:lipopolysaccharide biosynthesis protein
MRRPLLESPAFQGFWQSVVPLDRKDDIIDRYEIGMSEHFLQAGFRMAALYDAREHALATRRELWPHLAIREPKRSWRHLRKMRDTPHNPSECFPGRLLDAGVPFVKAGLFRVNHYGLNLGHVLDGVAAATPYDVRLIRQHLARVGGKPLESGGIRAILSPPSR